jgi:3-isopropylmalate/(R)-2-methylmalate dehydratase large subunit
MRRGRAIFEKIWDRHVVAEGPGGQTLLYIDRHLLHEGSAHSFSWLRRPPFEPRYDRTVLKGIDQSAISRTVREKLSQGGRT